MPYTLWSRGRLIGETELAYARSLPRLRGGDFAPSELGETLMPIIVGVGPALKALHEAAEVIWDERERNKLPRHPESGWPPELHSTTEYADAMSLPDELESLALELHDANGAVVATEDIWLQDTHRLLAMANESVFDDFADMELDDDLEAEIQADIELLESEFAFESDLGLSEPEFPRYQIFVTLAGHNRAMSRLARRKRRR